LPIESLLGSNSLNCLHPLEPMPPSKDKIGQRRCYSGASEILSFRSSFAI
jgi:hypothetical protein